jgi:hypothetical protein
MKSKNDLRKEFDQIWDREQRNLTRDTRRALAHVGQRAPGLLNMLKYLKEKVPAFQYWLNLREEGLIQTNIPLWDVDVSVKYGMGPHPHPTHETCIQIEAWHKAIVIPNKKHSDGRITEFVGNDSVGDMVSHLIMWMQNAGMMPPPAARKSKMHLPVARR